MPITSVSVEIDLETCLGDELSCNAPIQCHECFCCKWCCECEREDENEDETTDET